MAWGPWKLHDGGPCPFGAGTYLFVECLFITGRMQTDIILGRPKTIDGFCYNGIVNGYDWNWQFLETQILQSGGGIILRYREWVEFDTESLLNVEDLPTEELWELV